MKKQKFNLPVKSISFLLIILLAIFFIIGYIWKVLTTADFFSVKQVVVRNSDSQFEYLKGRNILNLNLNNEAWKAYLKCPDCRKVRFTRILPNCIVVDFLKRKPVALVKFYKSFFHNNRPFSSLKRQRVKRCSHLMYVIKLFS